MSSRTYGSHIIELSKEDKILFPDDGITKGDLISYYDRMADCILPYLKGRPLVLERFPDGIGAGGFFQKQAGSYFPKWIKTVRVKKTGGFQSLVVCEDRATLVYLANQAAIDLHPWLSLSGQIDCPDTFVMDLDPSSEDFGEVRTAARHCKALFDELGMPVFLKTTGSRGLHLVVPLSGKEDFETVRNVARRFTEVLSQRHPEELTIEQRKEKRRGRVYLDVARNAYAQTAVAPYSVRARPGAPVSTPIAWEELTKKKLDARSFTLRTVLRRIARMAGKDPWTNWRRRKCSMTTLAKRLDAVESLRSPASRTAARDAVARSA